MADPTTDTLRAALDAALGSQYEIIRLLGRGGMGAVYLARDRTLERTVAIKVLPPDVASSTDAMERFKREARTVASLSHPNIVPLYAFGRAGRLGYIVMGYVRGESLADRMAREGTISADETRRTLADIADALDYAHRQGIVHRDIKPDNILVDDATGRPMLTDFGIAKAEVSSGTLTQVGMVIGTPHYMSPEQASADRELDGRSDLYSLGVVGWSMLAGRMLFEGKSLHEVLLQHVTAQAPALQRVAPSVPDDLANAIGRALEKDPAKRWQDGKSFRQALGGDGIGVGENALSPELREHIGTGLIPILMTYVSLVAAGAAYLRGWKLGSLSGWWSFYPLVAVAFSLSSLRAPRRAGHSWTQIAQVAMWQPKWVPFWWPRRWRRPGDVSDRLPRTLTRLRALWSLGFVLSVGVELSVLPFLTPILETPRRHAPPAFTTGSVSWIAAIVPELVLLAVLAIAVIGALLMFGAMGASAWWGKTQFGLKGSTGWRMVGAPPLSPFWLRTEVAPVLAGVSTARATPKSPHELLRAIAGVAERLTGPSRSAGVDALAVAHDLVRDIEATDRDISEFKSSDDGAEMERLEARISAIDAQGSMSDERRQLRELLITQLDLLRRVRERLDTATRDREQRVGYLRTLWSSLTGLTSQTTLSTGDTTQRIRALVADIREHVPTSVREHAGALVLLLALVLPVTALVSQRDATEVPSVVVEHAQRLIRADSAAQAVGLLSDALATSPREAQLYLWRAAAESRIGQRRLWFTRAMSAWRIRGDLAQARRNDSSARDVRGEWARYIITAPWILGGGRARADAAIAAVMQQDSSRGHGLLGWVAHHDNDLVYAHDAMRKAVATSSSSAWAHASLAHVLADMGRNDEAIARWQASFAADTTRLEPLLQIGDLAVTTGTHLAQGDSAITRYLANTVVVLGTNELARAHYTLGQVREKQGRAQDALAAYTRSQKAVSSRRAREARDRLRLQISRQASRQ